MTIKTKIENFLKQRPTPDQMEYFYINEILPIDKRSISEMIGEKL